MNYPEPSVLFFLSVWYLFCPYVSSKSIPGLIPCLDSQDCGNLKNATCVDGLCNCDPEFFVCEQQNEHLDKILINFIGGKCDNFSRICNPINSECDSYMCVCKMGFLPSDDSKQCLKGLGEDCVSSEECSSMNASICVNSQCSCAETHVAKDSTKCLFKARQIGELCEDDVQCSSLLGIGSQCLHGSCSCRDDYHYKSEDRTCVKNLNLDEFCGTSEECHQPGQESVSRLMCIEGVCKCRLDYVEENGYCIENSASTKNLKVGIFLINALSVYFYNYVLSPIL